MKNLLNLFSGDPLADYFHLTRGYPHLFHENGKLKIILDPIHIKAIEEQERLRWLDEGIQPELAFMWSRAGIISFDPHLIWLRDVVQQPDGSYTLFKRVLYSFLLHKSKGVAVCGLTPEKEVVLIKVWRHAVQKWSLEIPRGTPETAEAPLNCAKREFEEETGHKVLEIYSLGSICPDSGILSHEVEIFFARVSSSSGIASLKEDCIERVHRMPLKDLQKSHYMSEPFLTIALKWMIEHEHI